MTKISQLTDLGANLAAGDEFVVRDVSDISTPNKKVTASGFVDYVISQGTVTGFTQIAAGVGPLARALASSSGATGTLTFSTATATTLIERARIDSSGRLLVGTSTARTNVIGVGGADCTPVTQFESASERNNGLTLVQNDNTNFPAILRLATSLGTSVGSNVALTSNFAFGTVVFAGNDGTKFVPGAQISAAVDGTAGTNDMPGRLVFSTTADGSASPTERLRITSTGQLRLAGAGITFNGDTATANELDDYEEGTWTPTVIGATTAGTASYSTRNGRYTKIGRIVKIELYVNWNSGTGTGDLQISGLPFASNGDTIFPALSIASAANVALTAGNYPGAYPGNGASTITLVQHPTGGGARATIPYDASGELMIGGSYSIQ